MMKRSPSSGTGDRALHDEPTVAELIERMVTDAKDAQEKLAKAME